MYTYIHTCIHTYIHVYMYTCIHTYMYTCIHVVDLPSKDVDFDSYLAGLKTLAVPAGLLS